MLIEDLWEKEPRDYFEHCYMVEHSKKKIFFYPEAKFNNEFKNKRKIFINLGSRDYKSSTLWFKNNYKYMKNNFNEWEVYCFECDKNFINGYEKYKNIKVINKAVYNYNGYITFNNLGKMATIISSSQESEKKIECINFIEFIKNNFNKEDFLLVKCDIEGSEYAILPDILENYAYFNEMFIEFHYNRLMNPSNYLKKIWVNLKKPRYFNIKHKKIRHPIFKDITFYDAISWIKKLRSKNIYAHWWL